MWTCAVCLVAWGEMVPWLVSVRWQDCKGYRHLCLHSRAPLQKAGLSLQPSFRIREYYSCPRPGGLESDCGATLLAYSAWLMNSVMRTSLPSEKEYLGEPRERKSYRFYMASLLIFLLVLVKNTHHLSDENCFKCHCNIYICKRRRFYEDALMYSWFGITLNHIFSRESEYKNFYCFNAFMVYLGIYTSRDRFKTATLFFKGSGIMF